MSINEDKTNNPVLLEVENLRKYFHVGKKQVVQAVQDVNFFIRKGFLVSPFLFLFCYLQTERSKVFIPLL